MSFEYEKPQLLHHVSAWQVWGASVPECYEGNEVDQSTECGEPTADDF